MHGANSGPGRSGIAARMAGSAEFGNLRTQIDATVGLAHYGVSPTRVMEPPMSQNATIRRSVC